MTWCNLHRMQKIFDVATETWRRWVVVLFRNLLPQAHACFKHLFLSQLELIHVLKNLCFAKYNKRKFCAKYHKQSSKNSKLWRRKKLGFCKNSTTIASITDLPVEVDKALIEADVSLQNVDAWAKKSLESVQVIKYWFSLGKWNQNVKFRYIQVMKK